MSINVSIKDAIHKNSKITINFIVGNNIKTRCNPYVYEIICIEITDESTPVTIIEEIQDIFNKKVGDKYGQIIFDEDFIEHLNNCLKEVRFLFSPIDKGIKNDTR